MSLSYYHPPADRVGPNGVKVLLVVAAFAVLVWLLVKLIDRFTR